MSTSPILPHVRDMHKAADRIARELDDLSMQIFVAVYAADWDDATRMALAELPDLMAYADDYDTWTLNY
jgi:hypothetical protein